MPDLERRTAQITLITPHKTVVIVIGSARRKLEKFRGAVATPEHDAGGAQLAPPQVKVRQLRSMRPIGLRTNPVSSLG